MEKVWLLYGLCTVKLWGQAVGVCTIPYTYIRCTAIRARSQSVMKLFIYCTMNMIRRSCQHYDYVLQHEINKFFCVQILHEATYPKLSQWLVRDMPNRQRTCMSRGLQSVWALAKLLATSLFSQSPKIVLQNGVCREQRFGQSKSSPTEWRPQTWRLIDLDLELERDLAKPS